MVDRNTPSEAEQQGAWARPVEARHGEALMALVLLATAAFFIWHAVALPFGTVRRPGAGFFPFALGIALGLLALLILIVTWRAENDGEVVYVAHRDVLVVLAALGCVAYAFERADTYVTLGVFTAVVLLLVARAALWRVLLGATLGMVAVWVVFNFALGVRFPVGEFWGEIAELIAARLPSRPF